jgi:hypothetical protein
LKEREGALEELCYFKWLLGVVIFGFVLGAVFGNDVQMR